MLNLLVCLLTYWSSDSHAQMTPVGSWYTVDDKTQEVKSEIRIVDNHGVLSGRIEKLLRKGAKLDAVCGACTDERKGKPLIGLDIIQGARKAADEDVWEGGKILDPETGKSYTLKLIPIEGGKKLEVRGYITFFRRTQIWIRAASP
jgi:uncharacterized protein (DUF2147 family)